MEQLLQTLPNSPIVGFTALLLVILIVPPIFERLQLPGLVGLLVAGVALGNDGVQLLDADSEMMKLLSDIGKIYLMFVAGLEIDLEEFRKTKHRSIGFGLATFLIPLAMGTAIGQLFGMNWISSILLGSLIASHTLLGYPIVNRLGVVRNQAVTVTIGATIFTDIAALLVLAICVSASAGEFSLAMLVTQLGALAIYAVIILFGLGWAGKEYFRRTGDQQGNQFLFILLVVFLASVGAQIINVDKIVGAFLAGLAVNDVVGHTPVEEKVEFVGSTLFIPFFFVDMGLLLNVSAFVSTLNSELALTAAIVSVLFVSKFLASLVTKLLYRYSWVETLTMWSLSLPQVAATLAAALVGVNAGLLDDLVFNAIIVLMLVTAVLGPVLTARFAPKLPLPQASWPDDREVPQSELELEGDRQNGATELYTPTNDRPFTVVVPVANPHTERYLTEMAALLARRESGRTIPLSVAKAHVHMDEPTLDSELNRANRLLQRAERAGSQFEIETHPVVRIDDDIAHGISRTAKEWEANLVVMGWSSRYSLQARLFGSVIDSVFWSSHCPVAVVRLLDEPTNIRRILVPVKNITPQALLTVQFAHLFANTNQSQVTLLHVSDRKTPKDEIATFQSNLSAAITSLEPQVDIDIQTICHDDAAEAILKKSRGYDMLVLRSMRRRTIGGLAVSNVTTQVLKELPISVVLFGEPHSMYS
jgi:Kef-type K+ transport system membrane component KefB/nucleotide-binding universal stress UspA family protein